jgi:flagellar motor switch protein FliN/FliY
MANDSVEENKSTTTTQNTGYEKIARIPVELTIEVGRAKLTVQEIMALKEGDVVALNKLNNDLFDIMANGRKVAEGQVVLNDDQFYVKIANIVDKGEL